MRLLDLTLPTAEENLALEEAMLEEADQAAQPAEVLRLWESPTPLVVVGRSSKVAVEVNVTAARRAKVPILRRCSGGAAIVAGPGCLMYAVILSYQRHPHLQLLDEAHRFVLGRVRKALMELGIEADHCGTSDLAQSGRKFSGNSLRCKRTHLLYHGTLLCSGFEPSVIGELLGTPPRQPDYRAGRGHGEFVTTLRVRSADVRRALIEAWGANEVLQSWPEERTRQLVTTRYGQPSWNIDGA